MRATFRKLPSRIMSQVVRVTAYPFMGAIFVVVVGSFLAWNAGIRSQIGAPSDVAKISEDYVREAHARAVWLSLCLGMLTMLMMVVVIASSTIVSLPGDIGRRWFDRTCWVSCVAAVTCLCISVADDYTGFTLAWEFYELQKMRVVSLGTMYHLINGAIAVPLIFALSAMASTVPRCERLDLKKEMLAHQMRLARNVLAFTAISLVLCVVQMSAIFEWIAAGERLRNAVVSGNEPNNFDAIVSYGKTTSGFIGAIVTILLAAVFAPVAYVHRCRAVRFVEAEIPQSTWIEKVAWMQSNGLGIDWRREAVNIMSIFGPIIAGSPWGQAALEWVRSSE